jgi:hypothetical protein
MWSCLFRFGLVWFANWNVMGGRYGIVGYGFVLVFFNFQIAKTLIVLISFFIGVWNLGVMWKMILIICLCSVVRVVYSGSGLECGRVLVMVWTYLQLSGS